MVVTRRATTSSNSQLEPPQGKRRTDASASTPASAASVPLKIVSIEPDEVEQQLDMRLVPALAICCAIAAICALDRVVMSVAIIPMAAELGFTDATKGLIAASFR